MSELILKKEELEDKYTNLNEYFDTSVDRYGDLILLVLADNLDLFLMDLIMNVKVVHRNYEIYPFLIFLNNAEFIIVKSDMNAELDIVIPVGFEILLALGFLWVVINLEDILESILLH